MITQDFIDLFNLGLKPIPLEWNSDTKTATSHCIAHGDVTNENYTESNFMDFVKTLDRVNGIALKLFSPFGCIDFDLKNTDDKEIFNTWVKAVSSIDDSILSKVCIETTRNKGYHVYIKYSGLKSKISLAQETKGEEVIAVYTGGTLSYCDPTPGYNMIQNSFEDLEELTADEFDILTSCAISFNKYVSAGFEKSLSIVAEYPVQYENICLQFDAHLDSVAFETILNDIDLFQVKDYKYNKKDKFAAFLRKGSAAKYSAKVYFNSNKLLIFSSSITGFPSWGTRKDKDDHTWVLTAAKVIFYKNDCDWVRTIEEILAISESLGIDLVQQPITNQDIIPKDRLKFPYDVFPENIQDFIAYHPFQNEYIAGAFLTAFSTAIGNSYTLVANDGYFVKPILYLAVVAPPGASKSPALKSVYTYLEKIDNITYKEYEEEKSNYKKELAHYKNQKKGDGLTEPELPVLKQLLIKDSTIEMVVKILSTNIEGCCIVADELSGFLKRMNRYGDNDEVQKWLELWSGSPVLLQRISREENKVENPFCSIFGGIQPGVLESLSSKDNQHNGFYHRFLFVYPEMDPKKSWGKYSIPHTVKESVSETFSKLMSNRGNKLYYRLSDAADEMYGEWFNNKNIKYNKSPTDNVKGIIAKYQDYCLRFSLLLQTLHDDNENRDFLVSSANMERAIRLTEYFLGNMYKSMKVLAPEIPIDKISGVNLAFYKDLPHSFTNKTALETAKKHGIKPNSCRVLLTRWSGKAENILSKTGEQKQANYEKIFE